MASQRKIEIFNANCAVCAAAINQINRIACPSCDIIILDIKDQSIAERAREIGVRSVPAIAIDGVLADCCGGRGLDEAALRAAGLGQLLL